MERITTQNGYEILNSAERHLRAQFAGWMDNGPESLANIDAVNTLFDLKMKIYNERAAARAASRTMEAL